MAYGLDNSARLVVALTSFALVVGCTPKSHKKDLADGATVTRADQKPVAQLESPTTITGDTKVTELSYIQRGHEPLVARLWLLNQAKKSVRIQAFIFTGDESGSYVADKLIALKKSGIAVTVAVDELTNLMPKQQVLYARMSKNGIKVQGFDPGYLSTIGKATSAPNLIDSIKDANKRYHDKMFIIDGEDAANGKAIIGGINIANEYFDIDGGDFNFRWQDQDIMVRGPIVQDMAAAFDRNQAGVTQTSSGISTILTTLGSLFDLEQTFEKLLKLRPAIEAQVAALDNTAPILNWREAHSRFVTSRPRLSETYIFDEYKTMIEHAKSSIDIANYLVILTTPMQQALVEAAQRGVKVRILTGSPETCDQPILPQAARTLYYDLIMAANTGAKGSLTLHEWGGDPYFHNGYGLFHAKYMVVDGRAGIVGSFNMDPRSQFLNREAVVVFEEPTLAAELLQGYEKDFGDGFATNVSAEQAKAFKSPNDLITIMQNKFVISFKASL